MKQTIIAAALAVVFLSGCSLAPTFSRPAVPVPATVGAASAPAAADFRLPEWRAYFTDAAVQSVIDKALANNRDMRIAIARVEEARAQYGVQRADRLPNLSANGTGSVSKIPADLSSTGKEVISRRYDVNLGLLSFELDFWGRVKSLSDAARANYLASEEAQRSFQLSLIAEAANAWYSARALDEQAAFSRKTVKAREENLRVVNRRVEAGTAGRLEQLQAEAALDSARADAASYARRAENARNALNLTVGETVVLPEAKGEALADLPLAPALPEGLPSSVLLNRPDVRQAEQTLIAANANIGAARAAFFPKISLVGSAGVASNELEGIFSGGHQAWSFAPSISLPIFHGWRNKSNLDLAEARKNIAVAQYEKTIQTAFQDVANVLADQKWLTEQYAAQEKLAARQSERLRLADLRYQTGLVGYLDLLDAQREHYAAQLAFIEAKRARLAAAAQAFKALGGAGQ
ncbi:outer membrane protein, multidrug efflux system [Formivibrio citricus]|uniref:Outer membrane protein, multidrug efflux system n=1 Tax=Formivibrio citricus TaxID=83765 RepID=A0A1I5B5A0_9NEIS|nr:efflux transporter outer membrane subunit [Formivibrio citricus]SFN69679.1 outer membrane protein, multidrug efflux system [Formivibrio citricus]